VFFFFFFFLWWELKVNREIGKEERKFEIKKQNNKKSIKCVEISKPHSIPLPETLSLKSKNFSP